MGYVRGFFVYTLLDLGRISTGSLHHLLDLSWYTVCTRSVLSCIEPYNIGLYTNTQCTSHKHTLLGTHYMHVYLQIFYNSEFFNSLGYFSYIPIRNLLVKEHIRSLLLISRCCCSSLVYLHVFGTFTHRRWCFSSSVTLVHKKLLSATTNTAQMVTMCVVTGILSHPIAVVNFKLCKNVMKKNSCFEPVARRHPSRIDIL